MPSYINDQTDEIESELILKTIGGSNQSKTIRFDPVDAPIKIGSNPDCQI